MATALIVPGDALIQGNITFTGSLNSNLGRSNLAIESAAVYPLPWTFFRVWDALATNLPGTSASDDLGLTGGTFGTNTPSIQTSDMKTLGAVSRYARFQFQLPPEYVTGQAVSIRLHAGMVGAVADTTCTIDVECYKSDREAGLGSDLCTTAAQSINSLVLADKTFTITSTSLAPGDVIDVRLTIATNDAAGASSVVACIGEAAVLLNIRG